MLNQNLDLTASVLQTMRMDAPIKPRCLAAGEKATDPLCSSNRQGTKSE